MKHTRSRLVRLFALVFSLCLAALTGCAQSPQPGGSAASPLSPDSPVTIVVWTYYNGPQKLAFDDLVLEFNETVGKEQGVAVESISHSNVTELTDKVMEAAQKKVGASDIPQIFSAYADTAYAIDQLGVVANLDAYLTAEELAEFVPGYIEEGRLDAQGNLKIFPIAKSTEVLMLNQTDWDKFAAATGAELSSLATMEGVAQTAASYYEWSGGKAFFGRDALANYFIIGCKELGAEIFSVQNGTVTVNCDEAILRRLWDNYYVPFMKGHFAANGRFRSDDAKTGDIIALVCSTTGGAYFPAEVNLSETESYPIQRIVLPAPLFEGASPVAVQQGAGMVVTKGTPAQEYASVVFLKWFTEAARNAEFSSSSGYLPVKIAANDEALLESALAGMEPSAVTDNLSLVLPVAIQTVHASELYTNKAFQQGTGARAVLENTLSNQLEADLAVVEQQMAEGASREEAISEFLTDAHFEQWYAAFQQELRSAAGV